METSAPGPVTAASSQCKRPRLGGRDKDGRSSDKSLGCPMLSTPTPASQNEATIDVERRKIVGPQPGQGRRLGGADLGRDDLPDSKRDTNGASERTRSGPAHKKTPTKQAVSRGFLSDADGARTRNHWIDSPTQAYNARHCPTVSLWNRRAFLFPGSGEIGPNRCRVECLLSVEGRSGFLRDCGRHWRDTRFCFTPPSETRRMTACPAATVAGPSELGD